MKFFLTGLGNLAENWDTIDKAVVEADQLGFDGALMPDHYMWGQDIGHRIRNPYHTLETWTALTYLAGKTENIKLGTLVTPLPLRHPGVLAKRLSTLDNLSGGRVILGVGAGWSKVEFTGYSEWGEAKYRVDKTIEALDIIIRLWTEPKLNYKSDFYDIQEAVLEPKPVQKPYPQLLFGSTGKRMLKLTGRYANICFIPPWSMAKYREIKDTVIQSAEAVGRRDEVKFMGGIMGASQPYETREYEKTIESVERLDVTYVNIAFPRDTIIESMRSFAKEIMPSYR